MCMSLWWIYNLLPLFKVSNYYCVNRKEPNIMKTIIFLIGMLAIVFSISPAAFGQIRKKDKDSYAEIGEIRRGNTYSKTLTEIGEFSGRYVFIFRDLKYPKLMQLESFYFDGEEALFSFYDMLIMNLDSGEKKVVEIEIDYELILEVFFERNKLVFRT